MSSNIVVLKKYKNRKLYNTQTSKYATLDDIKQMIVNGGEVQVVEHNSNRDITIQTLATVLTRVTTLDTDHLHAMVKGIKV